MLTPEERESARRYADLCSSDLPDREREYCLQKAHGMIEVLREELGSDEAAFKTARYLVYVLAAIGSTPVMHAASLIEHSIAGYAFAAGNLAGVYELPERKPDETLAPPTTPMPVPDEVADADTGMYL